MFDIVWVVDRSKAPSTTQHLVAMVPILLRWFHFFFVYYEKFPNVKVKLPLWAKLGDRGTFSIVKFIIQSHI